MKVRAKVTLSPSVTKVRKGSSMRLTATVTPASNAGSSAVFEYYNSRYGKWSTIAKKTLKAQPGASSATAVCYSWTPPAGTIKTRVRFLGSTTNVATTSATKTLYVK
ncbi:MAG TPA: hypothetical protein VLA05_12705 [Coriobacteriia bacterium]|nr:hypothetical protein [Coriobacteriia bacterium]